MEAAPHPWPTIGVLLLRDGLVRKDDLEDILAQQRDSRGRRITGRRLGEILVDRGTVTETQVAKLVAEQYELPFVELESDDIDLRVARLLSEELSERFSALPINQLPDGTVLLAVADPATVLFSDELRRTLGFPLRFVVVAPEAFRIAVGFVSSHPNGVPEPLVLVSEPDSNETDGIVVSFQQEDAAETTTPENEEPYFGTSRAVAHLWPPLGALLIREGLVNDTELEAALAQQRLTASKRLGEILVERGAVTSEHIARLVAEQYELPFLDLGENEVDPTAAALLPEEIARRYSALAVRFLSDELVQVAVADPTNVLYSDELHNALRVPVSFAVAAPNAIEAATTFVYAALPQSASVEFPSNPPIVVASTPVPAVEEPIAEVVESVDEATTAPVDAGESVDDSEALAIGEVPELFEDPIPLHADEVFDDTQDEVVEEIAEAHDAQEPEEAYELEVGDSVLTRADAEESHELDTQDGAEPESDHEPDAEEREFQAIDVILAEVAEAVAHAATDEAEESELAIVTSMPVEVMNDPMTTDAYEQAQVADDVASHADNPPQVEAAAPVTDEAVDEELDDAIVRALTLGASVVHLSPQDGVLVVRARIDGVLHDIEAISDPVREAALTKITEARTIETDERAVTLHATSLPTMHGNKLTVQIRSKEPLARNLAELGMSPDTQEDLAAALHEQTGLVVVCGPGASGKTTTLYAALQELNAPDRAIATVEGPVEHVIPGIDQVEVGPGSGVTARHGLRTVLHSDPDVIGLSHLPEHETTEFAARAAATRCLVLTTVEAGTATSALERLVALGIEPTLLAETLTALVSQRLVHRICEDCRETFYATDDDLLELDRPSDETGRRLLARGRGCPTCADTGYRGRAAIFELLPLTADVRKLLAKGAPMRKIERAAVEAGMQTLRDDGVRLCLDGITTAAEVQRVTGSRLRRS